MVPVGILASKCLAPRGSSISSGTYHTHLVGGVDDGEAWEASQVHGLPQQREGRRDHGLAGNTGRSSCDGEEDPVEAVAEGNGCIEGAGHLIWVGR